MTRRNRELSPSGSESISIVNKVAAAAAMTALAFGVAGCGEKGVEANSDASTATPDTASSQSEQSAAPVETPQSNATGTSPEGIKDNKALEYPTPVLLENTNEVMSNWENLPDIDRLEFLEKTVEANHPEVSFSENYSIEDPNETMKRVGAILDTLSDIYNQEGTEGEEMVEKLLDIATFDSPSGETQRDAEKRILNLLKYNKDLYTNLQTCYNVEGACDFALDNFFVIGEVLDYTGINTAYVPLADGNVNLKGCTEAVVSINNPYKATVEDLSSIEDSSITTWGYPALYIELSHWTGTRGIGSGRFPQISKIEDISTEAALIPYTQGDMSAEDVPAVAEYFRNTPLR